MENTKGLPWDLQAARYDGRSLLAFQFGLCCGTRRTLPEGRVSQYSAGSMGVRC